MLLQCLPSSLGSIQLTVRKMSIEDGRHGRHLEYRNGMILVMLNLHVAPMPSIKFRLMVLEQMWFQDFQDRRTGGHLGQRKGTIVAILNLYVAPMLSIKFRLSSTYGFGDVVKRISRWPLWGASSDIRSERFSNFWIFMSPQYLPSCFGSIQLNGLGGNVVWRILSWLWERNNFNNSESQCHSDAFH